jgi:hypothetical protein
MTLWGCEGSADFDISSRTVEATINGSGWKGSGGTGVKQTVNTGQGSVTTVTVVAAKLLNQSTGDNETMEVTIYGEVGADNIEEREYDVEEDEIPGAQFSFTTFINNERVSYFATSGTVTVRDVTEDGVQGTFEGTLANSEDASDTKEVTGGGFNVDFGYNFEF